MKDLERIGEGLKSLRQQKGLTQRRVQSESGVSLPSIVKMEKGAGVYSVTLLEKLCAFYGIGLVLFIKKL